MTDTILHHRDLTDRSKMDNFTGRYIHLSGEEFCCVKGKWVQPDEYYQYLKVQTALETGTEVDLNL